jgi:CheY-specific phosphatase CheX
MRTANYEVESTLNKLLQATLEQTLKGCASNVAWVIDKVEQLDQVRHDRCIVLTISSFKFRIMCLLHLSMDAANRTFVAEATSTRPDELDDSVYTDYLLEMSNSFCGNLKRHLQSSCPPLGMSTPNFLDRASLELGEAFKPTYSVHARARVAANSPALFSASALVCVKDDDDFSLQHYQEHVGEVNTQADSSGELELF